MRDQAARLRELALERDHEAEIPAIRSKTLAVSSGKGGVGKSVIALNLSYCLAQLGHRTLLFDADMGMGNIDIMLGLRPAYNMYHVVTGQQKISDIILPVAEYLDIIPGGSGIPELANLGNDALSQLLEEMASLERQYEYMIVDTGAGISNQAMRFLLAADEIIMVTTPEPTAFTDAYGIIKSLHTSRYNKPIHLILNRVRDRAQGKAVAEKMQQVSQNFLGRELNYLGSIRRDPRVEEFICNHQIIVQIAPHSLTARSISAIAEQISPEEQLFRKDAGIRGYFQNLLGIRTLLKM